MSGKNIALLLNFHHPYIRHSDESANEYNQENFLLFEKITNVYIPLLNMISNLKKDNVNVEISLATRTYEEQDRLYSKGRNEKGEIIDESKVVTYAKGGQSYHNFGLAFDVEVYNENGTKNWNKQSEAWQKVINEGKKQGFVAGAEWNDFPDLPHFENSFGKYSKCSSIQHSK